MTQGTDALRHEILALVADYARQAHGFPTFSEGKSKVPVSGKVYGTEEIISLVDASLDFWLTAGRFNDAFEAGLKAFLGRRFVLTVNSGSSANLLAVSSLSSHLLGDRALKPGDEVITCATGFPTTVNPIIQNGLVPVFLDVHIPTYNVDVARLEEAIGPRTRAIVLAHTLGNPFDIDTVMAAAAAHDLLVVEDCCDALGATYRGQQVGTFGDIGTLSFYPAHHITTGEGGAVFTARPHLKRAMESIRDWGRECWCPPGHDNTCKSRFAHHLGDLPFGYDHKYTYSHLGYNLKLSDMQAAVGLAQLDRLDGFIMIRQRNFLLLLEGLRTLEEVLILPQATAESSPSWFGFPITLRAGAPFERDELLLHLNSRQIGTRLLFGGNLLRQPYMKNRAHRVVGQLANSDLVTERTFWIGVFPGLCTDAIAYAVHEIKEFCSKRCATA
jgi:CDP-6-deoxy-D-xylo-4-hexulose-3-dehydrase